MIPRSVLLYAVSLREERIVIIIAICLCGFYCILYMYTNGTRMFKSATNFSLKILTSFILKKKQNKNYLPTLDQSTWDRAIRILKTYLKSSWNITACEQSTRLRFFYLRKRKLSDFLISFEVVGKICFKKDVPINRNR